MAERKRSTSSPIFIGKCLVEIDGGSVVCESIVKGIVLSTKNNARIRISEYDPKKETFRRYYSKRRFKDCSQDEGTRPLNSVDNRFVQLNPKDVDSCSKMANKGDGDEPPRKSITSNFFSRKKLVSSGQSHRQHEPDQSLDPVQTRDPAPSIHTTSSTHVPTYVAPSSDQVGPVTSGYPSCMFPSQPYYHYPKPPPPPHYAGPTTSTNPQGARDSDSRMLIEPNEDTFYPSKQPTDKIRDIIRSMFDAPYMSWKKIPPGVRDMWFSEFGKDFRWLPQHYFKIKINFEKQGLNCFCDMSTDIRKSGQRPMWIKEDIWRDLCKAWDTSKNAQRRAQNKQNKASNSSEMHTSLHIDSSIPYTEHIRKLKQSLGRESTLLEPHTRTHQCQESQDWDNYIQPTGEGSLSGSPQQSEYDHRAQTVGEVRKDKLYGLGSQATAYNNFSYPCDVPRHEIEEMSRRVSALNKEMNARIASMESQLSGMKAKFDRMEENKSDKVIDDKS